MAFLRCSRLWNDELIELASARMALPKATNIMNGLAEKPGQRPHGEGKHGDFWIEVVSEKGDLIIDPVCFPSDVGVQVAKELGGYRNTPEFFTDKYTQQQYDDLKSSVAEWFASRK